MSHSVSFLLRGGLPVLQANVANHNNINWDKTIALVLIILIIVLFFALAIYSNILRDEVSDCDTFDANAEKLRKKRRAKLVRSTNPFSLSRVQLAVWTVIISCSYIYLQLCGTNCSTTDLNKTALILMGIGAGVTTAGALMDKREILDARPRHQNSPSEGFFMDILSDDNGISIHRFQNVIWTAIAMVIYINRVWAIKTTGCMLPELSDTLLALTGISSATYLVVKSQENNPPVEVAEEQAAAQNAAQNTQNPPAVIPPAPVPQNMPSPAPLPDPAAQALQFAAAPPPDTLPDPADQSQPLVAPPPADDSGVPPAPQQ